MDFDRSSFQIMNYCLTDLQAQGSPNILTLYYDKDIIAEFLTFDNY